MRIIFRLIMIYCPSAQSWQNEAMTVFFFSDSNNAFAVIAVSDKIKDSSVQAIRQLHSMGIEVHMLTGDNEQTAAKIAEEAGIDSYKSEVLPQAKHDFIKELQKQGKIVAMAGDGINDSQALAQADVSIAMGKGSDIAMDVAKMTIISSDLSKIAGAIRLSQSDHINHQTKSFLGIYLQCNRNPCCSRSSLPSFRLSS